MSLSEYLKNEMEIRSMNRAQFAAMLGIHQTQLERLLNLTPGKVPRSSTLNNLADRLGCSENELIALCYGNPITPTPSAEKGHCLQYGTCHDLIDLSVKINRENNPDQKVLNALEIAEILCSQDEERYGQIADRHAGTPEQWGKIFNNYSDSARIFYFIQENEGKQSIEIAGDWSVAFFPFGRVPFDPDGSVADNEIQFKRLPAMNILDGDFDLVILNMSLKNRYNNQKYTLVMKESFESWMQKTLNVTKIKNIYVNVYERDFAFFKELGFEQISPDRSPSEENLPVLFKLENLSCGDNGKFRFPGRKEDKNEIS